MSVACHTIQHTHTHTHQVDWITVCNQARLSAPCSLSVCAVIQLAVALEVMIVSIRAGTILNTHGSDCLHVAHATQRLLPSPQHVFVSILHVFSQTGYAVSSLGALQPTNQFQQRGSKTNVT